MTPADRAAIASCVRESGEMPRACIGTIAVVCAREPGTAREGGDVACSRREAAVWRERLEAWIMQEVEKGTPLPGLYPPNAETKARYEAETRKG